MWMGCTRFPLIAAVKQARSRKKSMLTLQGRSVFIIFLYIIHSVLATNGQMHLSGKKNALCTPQPASPVSPAPQVFLKASSLCHDVWLQDKTYFPSMAIRNIPLARSNSEALLLGNPMNWGFTWGVWLLASGVFSCVLCHRVHTRGSKIDTRLLQSN